MNPYGIPDEELLNLFHRESPDFDLMNSVNDELHNIAAAPCRVYKLDRSKSTQDDLYGEYQYRIYLPPIIIKMYYVEPTWTEELSRMGINMPEQVVFSINLQRLMDTIRKARLASSSASAMITISYNHSVGTEPYDVLIMVENKQIKVRKLADASDTQGTYDSDFELNFEDKDGIIDLNHAAVNTVSKLVDFINNLDNYEASFTGDGDVLSSKISELAGWQSIKSAPLTIPAERQGSVYDNVSDVIEAGDIVETFRRHEATRDTIEPVETPLLDPVTKQTVRGKLYEVRYAFVANETPTWHYINYNITADKVAADTLPTLLDKLPQDEAWTVGGDKWYA